MDDSVVVTPLRANRGMPSQSAPAQVSALRKYQKCPLEKTCQAVNARTGPSSRETVVSFCDCRSWMSVDLPPHHLFQDTLWMWASLAALRKVTSANIGLVSGRVLQLF